jgi:hypothetical protein
MGNTNTTRHLAKPIIPAAVLVFLLTGMGGALAQESGEYRGTASQQAACTPDVFRLCSAEIPWVERIVACLKRERPRLSEGCHAVFTFNHKLGHRHHFASDHHMRHHYYERRSERTD